MVLITAIRYLIHSGQNVTRSALIDQVQNFQYSGVTGPISFDTNGDIAHGIFSIYQVQSGTWVYLEQVTA
jgi:ABC-type branched-subunit amino acid transport system substrate-binding protein